MSTYGFQGHQHIFGQQVGAHHGYTSDLRASIGSSLAALRAGYTPKNRPTTVETAMEMATTEGGTAIGKEVRRPTKSAIPDANITPMTPPVADMTDDSITNWNMMSRRVAPTDLRNPISRVRSVTLASITFMITMPPITRKMETMPTEPVASVPVRLLQRPSRAEGST